MINKITIATHCWAVRHPLYAVFLRAQLSSIVQAPPPFAVRVCVGVDLDDVTTVRVINDFLPLMGSCLHPIFLDAPHMWRRCISRNLAARTDVDSDLIWFTDCDYLFLPDCLEQIATAWEQTDRSDMIWPRMYLANPDKGPIDTWWQANVDMRGCVDVDTTAFTPFPCRRAIGGVHCVSGVYAREHGYLHGHPKWQTPPATPFPDTRDDVAFRRQLERRGKVIAMDSLLTLARLRHTEIGYGPGAND